jgi:hypothetical protein
MLFIGRAAIDFWMQGTRSFLAQGSLLLGFLAMRIVSLTNGIGHPHAKGESYSGVRRILTSDLISTVNVAAIEGYIAEFW